MLIPKHRAKVKVTPGFFLLLGIIFYLDDGSGIMLWVVVSAFIHELGHIMLCFILGGRVEALTLGAAGAELKLSYPMVLTYAKENLVLVSGAAMNLLTGLCSLYLGGYWLAWCSFGLGIFNLLPVAPMDGGRILFNFVSEYYGPECAERVTGIVSGILIGIIAGVGVIIVVKYANLTLLFLSIWLLIETLKKKHIFLPN